MQMAWIASDCVLWVMQITIWRTVLHWCWLYLSVTCTSQLACRVIFCILTSRAAVLVVCPHTSDVWTSFSNFFALLCTFSNPAMSFLRATAGTAVARLSHRNSVRPSVCPSHGWIRQKRCKLGSSNLHHRLPQIVSGSVTLFQKFQ